MSARDLDAALAAAVDALATTAMALGALAARPTDALADAITTVLDAPGRVTVTGLGKSGLVGAKIAATLASTGTPATFVHAADALHGDSGAVQAGDIVIAISNSGTTPEVNAFAELAKAHGAQVISITGCGGGSPLAALATVSLDAGIEREADPHDLVPSTSTTVTLALGDALAIGLMAARGFSAADFGRYHPGGALGQRTSQ